MSQLDTTLTQHRQPQLARLLQAAKTCKLSALKRYLAAGGSHSAVVDVATGGKVFQAPLLISAVINHHGEHRGSIQLLLDAGASANAIGHEGCGVDHSALSWAAKYICCEEPLKLLLQRGADPCWQARADGVSALHLAVARGCLLNCKLLIKVSEGRVLNLRNKDGVSPARMAVHVGQVSILELLHKCGVKLSSERLPMGGLTLLHVAVGRTFSAAHVPLVEYLLSAGLDVNAKHTEPNSATALQVAACMGRPLAVEILVKHGADPSKGGATIGNPLTRAAEGGHTAIVELHLNHGMSMAAPAQCTLRGGMHLMMLAAERGRVQVVRLLLARGADANTLDTGGYTTLFYACASENSVATVKLLLQHGADPNIHPVEGQSPLLVAVVKGNVQCAQLLIDAGADVDAECGSCVPDYLEVPVEPRCTPLIATSSATAAAVAPVQGKMTVGEVREALAALNLRQEETTKRLRKLENNRSKTLLMLSNKAVVVKLLLAAGADVRKTTLTGNTCLHTPAACNYPAPVLCLLIKAGADLHAVNKEGLTAAAVAHAKGHTLAESLLKRAAQDSCS
jgi:uncharacterized protein